MTGKSTTNDTKSDFTIAIIGLGLIGGSLAMALKDYRNATILGVDIDEQTRLDAQRTQTVAKAYADVQEVLEVADLIIQCVYPHHIIEMMQQYAARIKPGTIVTDVCGTKMHLYEKLNPLIPDHIEYIGIHPMAGKEVDGFENAEGTLFQNTGFLITPLPSTKNETIEMMKELGQYIGASRFAVADAELHDEIIGYTSDLMHISATALCMHYHPQMNSAYTAGAFRDCTRISNINPDLWTELLLTNADKTLPHLDAYIEYLQKMKTAMQQQDEKSMHELLSLASKNKKEMLKR